VYCEDTELVGREPVDWEECLTCAGSWQNPCKIPYPILKAIRDDAERPHHFPSVTSLTGCLRKAWLAHTTDYYEYPSGRLALLVGTKMHEALEISTAEMANARTEIPVTWTTDDWIDVHGTADLWYRVNGHSVLMDWKTAKSIYPRKLPYGTHTTQVNLYAFMLANNQGEQLPVDQLKVVYLSKSGPGTDNNGIAVVDIQMMAPEAVREFINRNARVLMEGVERGTPPPKHTERWLCGYCPVVQGCEAIRD
jgi:hypothetical protein